MKNQKRAEIFVLGLIFNLLFACYNAALAFTNGGVWFAACAVYYLLTSCMRLLAVLKKDIIKAVGVLFCITALTLSVIIYISTRHPVAIRHGEIVMITVATYTFTKITFAAIRAIKEKGKPSVTSYISYAETAVSLLTMQRSMLVSFGNMSRASINIFNIMTGVAVCLFITVLGIIMIRRKNG